MSSSIEHDLPVGSGGGGDQIENDEDGTQPDKTTNDVLSSKEDDSESVISQQPLDSVSVTLVPSSSSVAVQQQLEAQIDSPVLASTSRAKVYLHHHHHHHHHHNNNPDDSQQPTDHLSDTSSGAGFTSFEPINPAQSSNLDEIEQLQPQTSTGRHSSGQLQRQPGRYRNRGHSSHTNHSSTVATSSSGSHHNIDYLLSLLPPVDLSTNQSSTGGSSLPYEDPIIIRGNGNITLFGLSNSFSTSFPSALLGRVSREEFEFTINRINQQLQQQHSTNAKFLLLGCLCCCCSLGCSLLWPTFALSKRTRNSLEKLLSMENSRLYNKLGLNLRLTKQQSHTNHSFMEYILVVDFLPKMHIYQPD